MCFSSAWLQVRRVVRFFADFDTLEFGGGTAEEGDSEGDSESKEPSSEPSSVVGEQEGGATSLKLWRFTSTVSGYPFSFS